MNIFLAGQQTPANRGCEALVVFTMQMLAEVDLTVTFTIPSTDITRDKKALSRYDFQYCTFVSAPSITGTIRIWNRLVRFLPWLATVWVPTNMHWPVKTLTALQSSDRVLHIGGDNFSYDYSYAGLISNTAQIDYINKIGKPQEIWCATVGPFDSCTPLEKRILQKLKKLDKITVREMASKSYLNQNGVAADLVADPAFNLQPEANDRFNLPPDQQYIVVNLSPYIYRGSTHSKVDAAAQKFVENRLDDGYVVLLLSHVNTGTSSDSSTIRRVFEGVLGDENVHLIPEDLTAAQFKGIVAASQYVVASRTHVTIAGFSSATPVVSIGYSAKASRLNQFLFGHESYVVKTSELDTESLERTFQRVKSARRDIHKTLRAKSTAFRSTFRELCKSTLKK